MSSLKPIGAIAELEQGRVMQDVEDEFQRIQHAICAYANRFGKEAKGAKAKLIVEVEITCENPEAEDIRMHSIQAKIKSTIPTRPPRITMAVQGTGPDGETDCLWAQASGTTKDDPHQMKLATDDGETINQETGEALADDAEESEKSEESE